MRLNINYNHQSLDAIDEGGALISPLGFFLAEFPINAMMAKMLYVSGAMGCSMEILDIIAMLQVQNVFSKPVSGQMQIKARVMKRDFEVAEGDLITLLNVMTAFVADGRTESFCGRHFLIHRNLKRAVEIRKQLGSLAAKMGIPLLSCNGDDTILRRCITAGFFTNAAYLHHSGVYKTVRGNTELNIHPLSTLYTLKQPQFVIFCELLHTTKLFMKDLTVIQPEWLTELAPHYYHKSVVRDRDDY